MSASVLRDPPPPARAPVNFEALLRALDEQCAALSPSLLKRFQFELDGMRVEVRQMRQAKDRRFVISATLGYLPFSIESAERRQAIKLIVTGARRLPNVHFAIDHVGKITAGGLFDVEHTEAPDFIFYPLTLFLQEARPFMQLIGRYL